jgi:hypothetical protein
VYSEAFPLFFFYLLLLNLPEGGTTEGTKAEQNGGVAKN